MAQDDSRVGFFFLGRCTTRAVQAEPGGVPSDSFEAVEMRVSCLVSLVSCEA
jgi:hypothetical protein